MKQIGTIFILTLVLATALLMASCASMNNILSSNVTRPNQWTYFSNIKKIACNISRDCNSHLIACNQSGLGDQVPLKEAIEEYDKCHIVEWLRAHFSTSDPQYQSIFMHSSPYEALFAFERICHGTVDQSLVFTQGNLKLSYKVSSHSLPDTWYSTSMTMAESKERPRWQAQVPFISNVVYPYIINSHVVYMTTDLENETSRIVVINRDNGRIEEQAILGVKAEMPTELLPIYKNGYIFIPATINRVEQCVLVVRASF